MPISPETMLHHYRILEKLGQGGMGEVWKAADTTLDREVAVKILPDAFAAQSDRLARFEREAKSLAALNHPAIAAVYGLHEAGGVRFLAMELAPGEELAALIKRGPVPVDEALKIAREIASALEAAHEAGIVHRDLKPANVMVDSEGGVKVLDFGLAKTFEADPGSSDASMTPTLTTPATRAGVIMGTAAYMSPEQARGKAVDKRSDIWAFGVVLWEMLAGGRAFQGETVSDTLASVLKESPDLDALPSGTPAAVRRLIARCLEKNPKQRLRDIGEARILLEGGAASAEEPMVEAGIGTEAASQSASGISRAAAGLLAVAGLALGALATLGLVGRTTEAPSAPVLHLAIPVPEDQPVGRRLSRPLAISPAGDRVVYVNMRNTDSSLLMRPMDRMEFEPVPGTGNAIDPFFSPDGRSLGFLDRGEGTRIKWIDLDTMVRATDVGVTSLVGAVWADDGYIYYSPSPSELGQRSIPIHRIPAGGGPSEAITQAKEGSLELHMWPEVLPGSNLLLYAAIQGFSFSSAEIRVHDMSGGADRVLIPDGQLARFVPSGHLVFLQGDTLLASRFDPESAELLGSPRAILSGVMTNPDSGSAAFAFSKDGTLLYLPEVSGSALATIEGFDREGNARPLVSEPADYVGVRASPDGTRLAIQVQEGPGQSTIRIHDIRRRTVTGLSNVAGMQLSPIWSSDGRWIYYVHFDGTGASTLKRVRSDGSGQPENLHPVEGFSAPSDASPDGRWILLASAASGGADLVLIPADGEGEARPYRATGANETAARISPDGRFAVYVDDSMGRNEVFIRSFPEPGEAWRISTEGGVGPAWTPDGREILYLQGADVMSVDLRDGEEPLPGPPRRLFTLEGTGLTQAGVRGYFVEILVDGTIVLLKGGEDTDPSTRINVITNWHAMLRELLP